MTDRGYIAGNRATWEEWSATFTAQREHAWPSDELAWGIWQVAEQSVGALPRDVSGMQAVELGCGTGRVSAWLARQGARTVAIDFSPNQLRAVRRLQARHGVEFALCEANAEELPFGDERFDLAVSDYGASIWSDPYLWIPEASRVLRPGGQLTFLVNGTIALLASPDAPTTLAEQRLHRDYFGMHRIESPDWPSVQFHVGYGDMVRLLRSSGFQVEDLIEIRPPEDAEPLDDPRAMVSLEWSRRWPCEEIWKATKVRDTRRPRQ